MKFLFTIKSKLYISFFVFLFATTTLAAMLFWYDAQMHQIEKLTLALSQIDLDIRQTDKLERDFFSSEALNLEFYETGDSYYALQHRELTSKLQNELLELRTHPLIPSTNLRHRIDTLRRSVIKYETTFDDLVTKIYQRGFKNQGYEGKMSEHLDSLLQTPLDKLLLYKIRQAEQRFLLYKEEAQIEQVNALLIEFQNHIEVFTQKEYQNIATRTEKRTEWTELTNKYEILWRRLAGTERKIGYRSKLGLKGKLNQLSNQIETAIEEINREIHKNSETFRVESRKKLIWVVSGSILLNLILGLWMIRKLGTPIKRISETIHNVIENDFSVEWKPIPIQHNDEIGRLSKDVNLLVSRILERTAEVFKQNNELQEQKAELEQQTEEIAAQRDLVESKNQSIYAQNEYLEEQQEKIQLQNKNITSSINYAKRIQRAMLPSQNFLEEIFPKSFVYFNPRDIVSGDFYFFTERDDKIVIAAVDCTGHGVPGAFMSVIGNDLLTQIVVWRGVTESNLILNELHNGIVQTLKQEETENRDGMDISLCVLDKKTNEIQYSGAKNSLLYVTPNGKVNQIKGDRHHIGGVAKQLERDFTTHSIKPEKGTRFYLLTDGYLDQFGGKHSKKYSTKRFQLFIEKLKPLHIFELQHEVERNFIEWKGSEKQIDDVLVIGFEV
ncbi:serine phosphatase RsbU, regulator of sigma subunit [Bernardetia litoralis DSM 6794]|uniref:Serine phosphatase RsbU, regulator of sigma subunit n=1 Tax=Bernardetia litoralis (strain ATCC 23117 / DSM 6794 / NBRC 15988 / NCIMB 1366 / Fx l1 / Sio-4) TaxID=880071 RepID=I4AGJ6_BERLS|nr:serine phosphatase RsbU, regulator of sigma subunit [Bernardetia litoralis DSM 6794]